MAPESPAGLAEHADSLPNEENVGSHRYAYPDGRTVHRDLQAAEEPSHESAFEAQHAVKPVLWGWGEAKLKMVHRESQEGEQKSSDEMVRQGRCGGKEREGRHLRA